MDLVVYYKGEVTPSDVLDITTIIRKQLAKIAPCVTITPVSGRGIRDEVSYLFEGTKSEYYTYLLALEIAKRYGIMCDIYEFKIRGSNDDID